MFSVIFYFIVSSTSPHTKTPSSPINGPMSWEFSDCVFGFPVENEWEAAPIKFSPTLFFRNFFHLDYKFKPDSKWEPSLILVTI